MRSIWNIIPQIIPFQIARATGQPGPLPRSYTFTLSTRCNSRCRTCNIWKKNENELSLSQWEKVLKSLGTAPYWVTISGGEPFLNKEIVNFAGLINSYCKPAIINIPTNGILPHIAEKTAQIAELIKPGRLIINVSLDGVGDRHDQIRGVPGNFKRFERTIEDLVHLKQHHKNLSIGIHTVISAFNQSEIEQIQSYAFRQEVDQYITEMAEERVELDTVGLPISPDPTLLRSALDILINGLDTQNYQNVSWLTRAFRLEYYQLVKKIQQQKKQVIPCYAGWISAQIYSDGTVWPCCVRADPMGKLTDTNYDFKKVWFNNKSKQIRASIAAGECWCPLANASYTNMICNFPTLTRISTSMIKEILSGRYLSK